MKTEKQSQNAAEGVSNPLGAGLAKKMTFAWT
jgi:hypothetical protein